MTSPTATAASVTAGLPRFFLHIPGAPSTAGSPALKPRAAREAVIRLQEIDATGPDREAPPEPQLKARPGGLLASMALGAMTGMLAARLTLPGFSALLLGGIAGLAAGGMVYAAGICVLACHQRESQNDGVWLRGDRLQGLGSDSSDVRFSDIEAVLQAAHCEEKDKLDTLIDQR